MWWNSLYWTNFPPLSVFDKEHWEANKGAEFYQILQTLNADKKLQQQMVTFAAAREDLCNSRPMPSSKLQITVECMQYDGVRDSEWNFPLQGYIPKRDNHHPVDVQARRFHDNNVIHLGLNAAEFSHKVMPVNEMDCSIHVQDIDTTTQKQGWGYCPLLLRVGGWPYKIKKIGTFEGYGDGGHHEITMGLHEFREDLLWDMLEGVVNMAPTGPNGEMEVQGNSKVGHKFWCQLLDLDWLGPKRDESLHYDPTVPTEKGYVWFKVVDTIVVPSTGKKGVRVELCDEGVLPAWLDLNYLKVFAGDFPLGCLNEAESDVDGGRLEVVRTFGERKVIVENAACRIVYDEPTTAQVNDFCDMAWSIFDCLYKGGSMRFGPVAGKMVQDAGVDEGPIAYKGCGPAPLAHNAYGRDEIHYLQVPRSSYATERRFVSVA